MKKVILLSALVALFSQSCKDKTKEPEPSKPTLSVRQQAMIGKDWTLKSVYVNGVDFTSALPTCVKDNVMYHFKDASNGYMDEGQTKCDAADSQRIVFTWKMINNENTLIVNSAESKDTFELVSVSATEFKSKADDAELTFKNP